MMYRSFTRVIVAVFVLLSAGVVSAQESQFASDLRREREQVAESCSTFEPKAIAGCVYTLVSSYPIHVALGNLSPGNGFGAGLALSERYTPNETWRITWSGDGVVSMSGAYRIGGYMKFIHTPDIGVVVSRPGTPAPAPRRLKLDTWVIDAVAQTTSLNAIDDFGEGPGTSRGDRASFGERQTIAGGSVMLPMSGRSWVGALRPALIAGIRARIVDIRPGKPDNGPSIERLYDDTSAPGLARQDPFIELREGVRLRPSLPNGWLRLNYVVMAQQFRTSRESQSSFNRWTLDLQHEIPLYRGSPSSGPPKDFNGPNECSVTVDSLECPPLRRSRDRTGTIELQLLMRASTVSGGNRVPFYFQPTLGGSDLNGERVLAAYDDYRFRAPSLLALREAIEHSLWGPIGIFAAAEQGRVGQRASDLGFDHMVSSATVGVTLRAGAFPVVQLSFSWGAEGHHVIGSMDTSLLGGSSRPSLY
jgi:hypothetical protein